MGKILFWSPLHGQGQTSNLHVTAFIMSMLHKKRVLIMQTHFTGNNLESPLVGQNADKYNTDNLSLFEDIGLDTAVTYSKMNQLDINMLENCCFSFPETQLLLLPGTKTKNKETFERDIGKSVSRVIQTANEYTDMVLIDANSGEDMLSFRLMDQADLIVVNLTQHRYVLELFFKGYSERFLGNNRVFFLFGDYDDNSSYNINNCRRKYSKFITAANSGVIPYCTQFLDAQNESRIVSFMQSGLHVRRDNEFEKVYHFIKANFISSKNGEENEYFFHRSKLAVDKMLGLLQLPDTCNMVSKGGIK
jgi:hypothetical protein